MQAHAEQWRQSTRAALPPRDASNRASATGEKHAMQRRDTALRAAGPSAAFQPAGALRKPTRELEASCARETVAAAERRPAASSLHAALATHPRNSTRTMASSADATRPTERWHVQPNAAESALATQLVSDSGEALRSADGKRMQYDDDEAPQPLHRNKWWRVSAQTVRLSVLEHLERAHAREVVSEQLRSWADEKVKQYGKDSIAAIGLQDYEQMGADDDERREIAPDPSGLVSDIKRAWEQRIAAEVEARLQAARDQWALDVQAELRRAHEATDAVARIEAELQEEADSNRDLQSQLAKLRDECQRLRAGRESERKAAEVATRGLEELTAQVESAARQDDQAVPGESVLVIGEVQQQLDVAMDDAGRNSDALQAQLDAAALDLQRRDEALALATVQLKAAQAQLQAGGGKRGPPGGDAAALKKELEEARKDVLSKSQEAAKWKQEAEKLRAAEASSKSPATSDGSAAAGKSRGGKSTSTRPARQSPALRPEAAKPGPPPSSKTTSSSSAAAPAPTAPAPETAALKLKVKALEERIRDGEANSRALAAEATQLRALITAKDAELLQLHVQLAASQSRVAALEAQATPGTALQPPLLHNLPQSSSAPEPSESCTAAVAPGIPTLAAATGVPPERVGFKRHAVAAPNGDGGYARNGTFSDAEVQTSDAEGRRDAALASPAGSNEASALAATVSSSDELPPPRGCLDCSHRVHLLEALRAAVSQLADDAGAAMGWCEGPHGRGVGASLAGDREDGAVSAAAAAGAVGRFLAAYMTALQSAPEEGNSERDALAAVAAALLRVSQAGVNAKVDAATPGRPPLPPAGASMALAGASPVAKDRHSARLSDQAQKLAHSDSDAARQFGQRGSGHSRRLVDTFTTWSLASTLETCINNDAELRDTNATASFTVTSYAASPPQHTPSGADGVPRPGGPLPRFERPGKRSALDHDSHFHDIFEPFAPSRLIRPISAPPGRASTSRSRSPPSSVGQPAVGEGVVVAGAAVDEAALVRRVQTVQLPDGLAASARTSFHCRRLVANPFKGFRAGQYVGAEPTDDDAERGLLHGPAAPGAAVAAVSRVIDPMAAAHMQPTRGATLARLDGRDRAAPLPHNRFLELVREKQELTRLCAASRTDVAEKEALIDQLRREATQARDAAARAADEAQALRDEVSDLRRQMFHIAAGATVPVDSTPRSST